jgi:hypothetical protein
LTRKQLSAIADLVAAYKKLDQTELRKYQETEVRTNFIDKLFSTLGWDMHDRDQVERETTVDEGKRPDYIFKLNTVAYLYLEAKAFREDARNLDFARDAITKAYNKGVDWAGVTNFTDIVIFDAKEDIGPSARPRGVLDLNLAQYAEEGSRLWLLTPTAIGTGDLTSRAVETGIRRRPVPIEKKLYQSMRKWREDLHNGLARFLDWTTDAQFRAGDDAIQNLIDRLIFLRNCEDRGFDQPQLRALSHKVAKGERRSAYVTKEIIELFSAAAATYDSEI